MMGKEMRSQNSGNVITAVWLIGIGILWMLDLWWPGILVVIGVSMLVRAMLPAPPPREAVGRPPAYREKAAVDKKEDNEAEVDEWEDDTEETPAFMLDGSEHNAPHRNDLLPAGCPVGGGPMAENAHKVEWRGVETAICPFCGADIPLKKT
ncbi:MAG: hypothetical protein MUO76_02715 [Anaerolineaceae bacterium]|nr:hypothetical protein [Anaerolineaceae bacterium]